MQINLAGRFPIYNAGETQFSAKCDPLYSFKMMYPDSEVRFINDVVGYGVFARKFIPRGTITWVPDELDQRFTAREIERLNPALRDAAVRYSYREPSGFFVLCWDHARFVNHSCNPNSLTSGFQFELAIRDIGENEQITDDYGLLNLIEPLHCSCGEAGCRRRVGPEDVDRYTEHWDLLVKHAFTEIGVVDQPLWSLLGAREEVEAVLAGRAPIPSCQMQCLR